MSALPTGALMDPHKTLGSSYLKSCCFLLPDKTPYFFEVWQVLSLGCLPPASQGVVPFATLSLQHRAGQEESSSGTEQECG